MSNHLKNIAIVGAGGNAGAHMVRALLSQGKHTITALQRHDSPNTPMSGCKIAKVDYANPSTIVSALHGIDALIITMNARVPIEVDQLLIRAAADAGVAFILPNDWGLDYENAELGKGALIADGKRKDHAFLNELVAEKEKQGQSLAWIGVCTGFWYEWSLPVANAWGFDFENKIVTLVDGGQRVQNTSTFEQVGRGVAALLSLPIKKEGGGGACLVDYKNGSIYISSFLLSQREMFESVLRVTGDKESDWTVKHEEYQERYEAGLAAMKAGDRMGFVQAMYTRGSFWPDEAGAFEKTRSLANEALGLPKEELDSATKRAVEGAMAQLERLKGYSAEKTS